MAPNVVTNPLPNYDTGRKGNVNMVKSMGEDLVPKVEQLSLYFEEIFEFTMSEGHLSPKMLKSEDGQLGSSCAYHGGAKDHEITSYKEFKSEVSKWLMFKILR